MIELVYIPISNIPLMYQVAWQTGMTVQQAITQSKIYQLHPEIQSLSFGIFSQPAKPETVLSDGDRIEFYRPLTLDPKDKRRERAKKNRQ